ncbi:aromatic prenyltransferase [Exidia glandulosa HHB12029]|uniref:Aromatic prenyltransferase n=1 Tax=Exidia glandulosa HHB12029 TaxID=1314781 RepID=A0A165Q4C3_EXIGL|nr:aromatic prenyltransferase [Exidia glandulosa HHB12029]
MAHSSVASVTSSTIPALDWLLPWRRKLLVALGHLYTSLKPGAAHDDSPYQTSDEEADDASLPDDERFWVSSFGPMLNSMLREGGYSYTRREEMSDFFAEYVAPFLGPEPECDSSTGKRVPAWKSFVTDDFTPLEPSWTWKAGRTQPLVKFSAEPIPDSPTAAGGVRAAIEMADALDSSRDAHIHFDRDAFLQVMEHLTSLVDPTTVPGDHDCGSTALSQVMLGFDVHPTATHTKAYLVPTLRALETSRSKLDVITEAIRACGAGTSWEPVLAYLSSQPNADPFLLAIDCAPLDKARFKVYVRFPTADIDRLIEHVSLGGRIPLSDKFVRAIRALWARLSAGGNQLYRVSSQTAGGTPMYFSVERHATVPTPKFYIPIRLLGWHDRRIAETIGEWMSEYGNAEAGRTYAQALQKLSPTRSLASRRGFHTYIGIVPLANGDIEPSVYLNPSIFS